MTHDLPEELSNALRRLGTDVALLGGDLSLENIIDACGAEFRTLHKSFTDEEAVPPIYKGKWVAISKGFTDRKELAAEGDTAIEAVGRLLCALHGEIID